MAAALYALAALVQTEGALERGRVQLLCFPDEESGATGNLGVKYLHSCGLLSGKGAIYAYSGTQIVLGHRGLIRYRLHCQGETAHTGSSAWQEKNRWRERRYGHGPAPPGPGKDRNAAFHRSIL